MKIHEKNTHLGISVTKNKWKAEYVNNSIWELLISAKEKLNIIIKKAAHNGFF